MSLIFYYAPGACSTASHIALEEVGAEFVPKLVDFEKREQHSEEYQKVNPRRRVATLIIDGEVLTEEVAILSYIARRFPHLELLPNEPLALARCLSFMAYIASSVHVAVGHIGRPERYADEPDVHPNMIRKGRDVFWDQLKDLNDSLDGKFWAMGDKYTVCDPYLLVVYRWGIKLKMPIRELPNFVRHNLQMLARPAVQRAYAREGHDLV
jgi:glutathione S-transferase